MASDDKPQFSRRNFHRIAVGAAAAAVSGGRAATAHESTDKQRQVPGGYDYDVVIVGGGSAGALAASKLAEEGLKVLILEAGKELRHPADNVSKYYEATVKIPESPWLEPSNSPDGVPAPNKKANSPTVIDMGATFPDPNGTPEWQRKKHYMIQHDTIAQEDAGGEYDPKLPDPAYVPFNSTYTRLGGGSTNHWLGIALRHVPNDFVLQSKYALNSTDAEFKLYAKDWPISYKDLEEWYRQAEYEVGVAGDVEYDEHLGAWHSIDKDTKQAYPMPPIALSYQDRQFKQNLDHKARSDADKKEIVVNDRTIRVLPIPQARNSVDRDGRPKCQGNSSCIPICPIQAKYDATVHLKKAVNAGRTSKKGHDATIKYQSVAYRVVVDEKDRVSKLLYKSWENGECIELSVTARTYVLAAHAIETAKLLLNSPWKTKSDAKKEEPQYISVANRSDQVGRNLMDHLVYIAWGYAKDPVYGYRGPLTTAGINDYRDDAGAGIKERHDEKREIRSAYRISIANDAWSWPVPPSENAENLIESVGNLRIRELVEGLENQDEILKDLELTTNEMRAQGAKMFPMHLMQDKTREQMQEPMEKQPFGKRVLMNVHENMIRQVRVGAELEALPLPDSRVRVSNEIRADGSFIDVHKDERDALGIPKPQIHYRISEYTKRGFQDSVETLDQILVHMGAVNTDPDPNRQTAIISRITKDDDDWSSDERDGRDRNFGNFTLDKNTSNVFLHNHKRYEFGGAGHIMGTYRMGDDPETSVVDSDCLSHDHDNLYLLGSGVFPSSGTANPTLTIMALALRAAKTIVDRLAAEDAAARA